MYISAFCHVRKIICHVLSGNFQKFSSRKNFCKKIYQKFSSTRLKGVATNSLADQNSLIKDGHDQCVEIISEAKFVFQQGIANFSQISGKEKRERNFSRLFLQKVKIP